MAASKRPLIILALACVAPFVLSTALYYWWTPPGAQVNYGTLVPATKLPVDGIQPVDGIRPVIQSDGTVATTRAKWLLVQAAPPQCEQRCQAMLYATRQSRTMTGKERDRVVRVWLLTSDGTPDATLLAQHPDVVVARADAPLTAALPADFGDAIWIIDPLGNLILRYSAEPDIKRLHRDLQRLLIASRIG